MKNLHFFIIKNHSDSSLAYIDINYFKAKLSGTENSAGIYMTILSCRRKKNSFYVSFGADTSIRYAARLKSALTRIMTEPVHSFHLDLSEVEDTDITFVQLLIAFNEKLKKQNRKMKLLKLPIGSRFISTVSECGVDVNSLFEIEDGS